MKQTDRFIDQPVPPAEANDGVLVDLRCSVALIKNDQILLLHRAAHPDHDNDGDWVLPGGRRRRFHAVMRDQGNSRGDRPERRCRPMPVRV